MSSPPARQLSSDLEELPPGLQNRLVLFRLLITIGGRLQARMDGQLADLGITTQQATFLHLASTAQRPPSLGEVAQVMGSTHQNARQLAEALVRKGLLEIVVDPRDRRVRRMVPTPKSAELWAARNPTEHAQVASWFAALDDAQVEQALALLQPLALGLCPPRPRP